jgi:beta-lactamase class A
MANPLNRRTLLTGAATLLPAMHGRAAGNAAAQLADIEQRYGGRLGIAAVDTGSGTYIGHRAGERFPMCSIFKFLAAAAVLNRVDTGKDSLDRKISYGGGDLLSYAPITKAHLHDGDMTLGALCAAALQWSDNTAGNLILATAGGPQAGTAYARTLGDTVTRMDRTEPTLNTAIRGDPRDTTTPEAMLNDMRALLLGQALSPASCAQLTEWLVGDQVGGKRLRAGVPQTWRVGDKTGTGDNGTGNTIGIFWPPNRAPILAAAFLTGSSPSLDSLNAAHAEVGGVLAAAF